LVSKDGYPLSFSVFNGSQYKSRTMLHVIEDFINRFNQKDFIVVANSGLMNHRNIALLESGNYIYSIGARIKNESNDPEKWTLSLNQRDGEFYETRKGQAKLIVSHSTNRAKKDKYNREKGKKRLEKAYRIGNITKETINKRGYNKFLDISDNVKVSNNKEKIEQDGKWDGLKGYLTNTELSAKDVYEQYFGLWSVERVFRITKGTLEMRPMFHFPPNRIEAHICICFVALKFIRSMKEY
jgi:transposase